MKTVKTFFMLLACSILLKANGQNSLGTIQPNSNPALPSSYNFQEYIFAEPDDQGNCTGAINGSATISEVFLAQTHRHAIGHPLFFTIGARPALFQVAVTGNGTAPDVQVEGFMNGNSLGVLCLAGPSELSPNINLEVPNFEDYFSVTLPKSWIGNGLELQVTTGNDTRTISSQELKIGPYVELNLVMVNMDVMDYNDDPHLYPIFDDFLEELASAIPASVIRFGTFPVEMKFPEIVCANGTEQLVVLSNADQWVNQGIPDLGYVNGVASLFIDNLIKSTGDFATTIYFGNTLNLDPGGWGGGGTFVGPDFTNIFIHELGHALSLPHWEEEYNLTNPGSEQYNYPYGGDFDNAGGRNEVWNFIQDSYEFVSPICQETDSEFQGMERSDCMQREAPCNETRPSGPGPWDGFTDFSALSMYRYLMGGANKSGQVNYRGNLVDYHLMEQDGYPTVTLENGVRVFNRDVLQPQVPFNENSFKLPGTEQLETDVYLIYGSAHPTQPQANMVYEPLPYRGTLLPVLDPTDATTFSLLQGLEAEDAPSLYDQTRDLTLRLTYSDGSILHTLVPLASFERQPYDSDDFAQWRGDISYWTMVVPGDKELCKVEVFHRPFIISDNVDDTAGNINHIPHGINADNFMDDAVLLTQYECNSTSIEDVISSEYSVVYFPNPLSESVMIESEEYEGYTVSIFNISGQLISTQNLGSNRTEMNTKGWSSGFYIAVITDESGTVVSTNKLVKEDRNQ